MICKCPKCGSYTTGVIDKFLYAGICGRQSCSEIVTDGSETANNVDRWVKSKFGKHLGGTLGAIGKGAINATNIAVGQGRALVHSASALMDANDFFCFECKNANCKNEWVVPKSGAVDVSSEFFKLCSQIFLNCPGRKFMVINPDATVAYNHSGNTFMLRTVPDGICVPENSVTPGEIYVSHPAAPFRFYPLESYRMKVLEDELNDLKQFLLKLGAASISISGMSDQELSDYKKSATSNSSSGKQKVASAQVDAMAERENEDYRRLRNKFNTTIKGEIQPNPILDAALYNKWSPLNAEWNRIYELRKNGITDYTFSIETEEVTNAKRMELDKLNVAYSEFGIGAENNYAKETITKLKESKRMTFTIDVTFHSLAQYKNPQIITE